MIPRRQMPTQMVRNGYTQQRLQTYLPGRSSEREVRDTTAGMIPIGLNRFYAEDGRIFQRTRDGLVDISTGEIVMPVSETTSRPQFQGGGGSFEDVWASPQGQDIRRRTGDAGESAGRAATGFVEQRNIDDRLNRWYGDWITAGSGIQGSLGASENYEAYNDFMSTDVWGHPDDLVTWDWSQQPGGVILELAAAGGDIRGMLNRAQQMSQEDPDKFIRLQVALMDHGFLETTPTWGVWTQDEASAVASIIDAKYQWGGDKSLTDILGDARSQYVRSGGLSESGLEALRGVDSEAADELERLRAVIEDFEVSFTSSSSDYLKQVMQEEAVNTLGRRLNDQEMDALVTDVHKRERDDFYANDPQMLAYRENVRKYEDAMTNEEERRAGAVNGDNPSQVDLFLRSVADMESKGSGGPNAYNPDSQAFGSFQFIPSTWREVTRAAGLNPNDRSEENQWAAARYHAADIFSRRGSWYDVFISWYGGETALSYTREAQLASQWGDQSGQEYPSILAYADRGMQIFNSYSNETDPFSVLPENVPFSGLVNWATNIAGQVGEAVKAGEIDPNDPSTWQLRRGRRPGVDGQIQSVSDFNPGGPTLHESERFNPVAYLQSSAVGDSAGPEADAWNYALNASAFFDNLGRR